MDLLSYTAHALGQVLNKIAATVQFILYVNHTCVSYLIWILSSISGAIVDGISCTATGLRCCVLDFVTFLDEFGLTLYFAGHFLVTVGYSTVHFVTTNISRLVQDVYLAVHAVMSLVAYGGELLVETFRYAVVLIFSALLLILQGIPNGFILAAQAVVVIVAGALSLTKASVVAILNAICNSRAALVHGLTNIPTKAYVGLVILVFVCYLRKPISRGVKSVVIGCAVSLLFVYMKLLDCSVLSLRKTWRVIRRVLRRHPAGERAGPSRRVQEPASPGFLETLRSRVHARKPISAFPVVSSGDVLVLQRELSREIDRRLCIVCQDQERNVILLPCRHLCLCEGCCQSIQRSFSGCPLCRQYVLDTISVYT